MTGVFLVIADWLSNYGSEREPCTAKAFSPRLKVLSGFVFQRHSPGDTTLSEPRDSCVVSLRLARINTIGLQLVKGNERLWRGESAGVAELRWSDVFLADVN